MDDKTMLELAAKAAGFKAQYSDNYGDFSIGEPYSHGEVRWNPLTDDGDALRLAVKLNMGISIPVWRTPRVDVITFRDALVGVVEEGGDPYAATRRAIVRAAAAIATQEGE